MAILRVANKLSDFDESVQCLESTSIGTYDAAFVSNSIIAKINSDSCYVGLNTLDTSSVKWFHFAYNSVSGGTDFTTGNPITIRDSNDKLIAYFIRTNSTGSTGRFALFGVSTVYSGYTTISGNLTLDLMIEMDGTNLKMDVYIDGSLFAALSVAKGTSLDAKKFRIAPGIMEYSRKDTRCISEIILSTTSTLGMRLKHLPIDTVGFHNDFSGSLSNIKDTNPALVMISDAVGEKLSWNPVAYDGTSGVSIAALVAITKAAHISGSPSTLRNFLRIAGTDYEAANAEVIGPKSLVQYVWDKNPVTLANWETSELGSNEIGIKSET